MKSIIIHYKINTDICSIVAREVVSAINIVSANVHTMPCTKIWGFNTVIWRHIRDRDIFRDNL